MTQVNGLGQGDPFSVLIALLYVGVQMVALHLQCPRVQSIAVIDDRTIRGHQEDVCDAVAFVASLDKAAGHCNNLKKAAALVTTHRSGEIVDQFSLKIHQGSRSEPATSW